MVTKLLDWKHAINDSLNDGYFLFHNKNTPLNQFHWAYKIPGPWPLNHVIKPLLLRRCVDTDYPYIGPYLDVLTRIELKLATASFTTFLYQIWCNAYPEQLRYQTSVVKSSHQLLSHCGYKVYEIDAFNSQAKNFFPWALEWAGERANEWAQRSARSKRAMRSKRISEKCERTEEHKAQYSTRRFHMLSSHWLVANVHRSSSVNKLVWLTAYWLLL